MSEAQSEPKYLFISQAPGVNEDAFVVHSFEGREAMSEPYRFEISLASDQDFDLNQVLEHPARFVIRGQDGSEASYPGILMDFLESHEIGKFVLYKAELAARAQLLSLTERIRVFSNKTLTQVFKDEMADVGLMEGPDFEFRLHDDHQLLEFVTQFVESNFNFITRWMEREGIYFFFDQSRDREKIIFTDTRTTHSDLTPNHEFDFIPPTGLTRDNPVECVHSFKWKLNPLPGEIYLKDYNDLKPDLVVEGRARLKGDPLYYIQLFGYHFRTPEEGDRLARYQAEAQECLASQYLGASTIPSLRPGFRISLKGHPFQSTNQKYLAIEVRHSGHQGGYFYSRIGIDSGEHSKKAEYHNEFRAIEASLQYRMESKTPKPRLPGVMNGVIDSDDQSEYAEPDHMGRYKVLLPFSVDTKEGSAPATAYIRKQQPYAGNSEGMHFPLRKGTEVSLVCTTGDTDRMEIAGVIPNLLTPSPVSSKNPTQSVITTSRGNTFSIDDQKGSENILLHTPNHDTRIRLQSTDSHQSESQDIPPPPILFSSTGESKTPEDTGDGGLFIHCTGDKKFRIKQDEIRKIGGRYWENIGVKPGHDFPFEKESGKNASTRGLYVNGDMETVTMGNCIEQIGISKPEEAYSFSPVPQKGTYVNGNHHLYIKEDCAITARDKYPKITMTATEDKAATEDNGYEQKPTYAINLYAGPDQGLKISGKTKQGSIKKNKKSVVHGNSFSFVLGASTSKTGGKNCENLLSLQQSVFLGGKYSMQLSSQQSVSLATQVALDLLGASLAINLGIASIKINPFMNVTISPGLDHSRKEKAISYYGICLENGTVKKENKLLNIGG